MVGQFSTKTRWVIQSKLILGKSLGNHRTAGSGRILPSFLVVASNQPSRLDPRI